MEITVPIIRQRTGFGPVPESRQTPSQYTWFRTQNSPDPGPGLCGVICSATFYFEYPVCPLEYCYRRKYCVVCKPTWTIDTTWPNPNLMLVSVPSTWPVPLSVPVALLRPITHTKYGIYVMSQPEVCWILLIMCGGNVISQHSTRGSGLHFNNI